MTSGPKTVPDSTHSINMYWKKQKQMNTSEISIYKSNLFPYTN